MLFGLGLILVILGACIVCAAKDASRTPKGRNLT